MTIKVLEKTAGCFPVTFEIGDWFDLCTAEDIQLNAPQANKLHKRNQGKKTESEIRTRDVDFDFTIIPLGVAMQLPKGFEAHVLPRSSTFKKFGIMCANSQGIIDNSYAGNNDEWKFPAVATRKVTIPKGTRIAQFRIVPSQKATVWQKLRWLFSNRVKLKPVASLDKPERKGIGEGTGN